MHQPMYHPLVHGPDRSGARRSQSSSSIGQCTRVRYFRECLKRVASKGRSKNAGCGVIISYTKVLGKISGAGVLACVTMLCRQQFFMHSNESL